MLTFVLYIAIVSITAAYLLISSDNNNNNNNNNAAAQGPYLETKTVKVPPYSNSSANAYCEDGDGIITGGYSLEFPSINSPFNTMIYSNHPIQKINKTGYYEGWQAGLINKGDDKVAVSATTLCLNLTLTP